MTSLLEDLLNDVSFEEKSLNLTVDNMCAILLDFSNEEELRFKALELFYEKKGYEVVEILKKLVSIFAFAPTKILEKFFVKIIIESKIPFTLKLETSKDICIYKDDSDALFETLHIFIYDMKKNEITGAQQYEAITTLFRNNNFIEKGTHHFLQFISDKDTFSEYRYKIILSLETTFDLRKRWATKEEKEILDTTRKNVQEKCLILFLEIVPLITFLFSPLTSARSRKFEFQADAFAKLHANPLSLKSALLKLYKDNSSTLTPDPLFVKFYHSHPPAAQRLAKLEA